MAEQNMEYATPPRRADANSGVDDAVRSTWGAGTAVIPVLDTSATHLPRYGNLELVVAGAGQRGEMNRGEARGTSESARAPIVSALVAEAEKQHAKGYGCFLPRPGSQYSRADVPEALGCASCMSNLLIDAHKDVGKPLNYNRFHQVGVENWVQTYQQAGLISRLNLSKGDNPGTGDFIVAKHGPGSHPHIGMLSEENGTMWVFHNQFGNMVKQPLAESKFKTNGYRTTEYYRPK